MDKPVALGVTFFSLNGQPVEAHPRPGERLSETLRERLDARDVKVGCDAGDCGACTVLIDGAPVCACLTPAQQAEGREVETLSGLVEQDPLTQRLAISFEAHGAAQCGICIPGMMVSATALLRETSAPDETQVTDALGGVLCRCTGYRKIIEAVVESATPTRAVTPRPAGRTGDAIPRVDGHAKVTGTERFGDDIAPAGTLGVMVIRSPHHRAVFRFGDLEAWRLRQNGLEAVLTAADIPGVNAFGVIPGFIDQPVFAETEARFRGEAVAAIVGAVETLVTIDPAEFPVVWEERPAVLVPSEAVAEDAALLHEDRAGNIMCGGYVTCGSPEEALEHAAVTVEGHFTTSFVEHAYIEPEAGFAEMRGGRLELHVCTQAPAMNHEALQGILAMARADIRILPTGVGGGFGSKLDLSVQPYLALAALKTGKPVRMAYLRTESMQSTTKRHPAEITARIGATQDGKIRGMTFEGRFNTGAYASWGPTVANRVPVHASGPYRIADYRAKSKAVHTHCPPSGAFRGFGVPQSAVAQESLLDNLADKLGLDRLEFRISNALENGAPTVCGQVFDQGVGIKACLEALRPAWKRERAEVAHWNAANATLKRGVGVAGGWYG